MDLHGTQVTWLGHGTFKLRSPSGKTLLIDPWVQGNPACPEAIKTNLGALDYVLITHGHFDHIGDAIAVAHEAHPQQIVAVFELAAWLEGKGVQNTVGMNKGGTYDLGGIKVTMVHADHSCGISDGDQILYGGEAAGYVVTFENDFRLYASGDTALFGDMRLIGEMYAPQVAILPIGDFYTMGPREAAKAAQLLGVRAIIPGHYATFPALTGTPAALRAELGKLGLGGVEVAEIRPGQSIS